MMVLDTDNYNRHHTHVRSRMHSHNTALLCMLHAQFVDETDSSSSRRSGAGRGRASSPPCQLTLDKYKQGIQTNAVALHASNAGKPLARYTASQLHMMRGQACLRQCSEPVCYSMSARLGFGCMARSTCKPAIAPCQHSCCYKRRAACGFACVISVPSTTRNAASQAGCAGHAAAVTCARMRPWAAVAGAQAAGGPRREGKRPGFRSFSTMAASKVVLDVSSGGRTPRYVDRSPARVQSAG